MSDKRTVRSGQEPRRLSEGLRESVPLLATSLGLFAAGVVAWLARYQVGPPLLPIWALLLVLGFVAGIGAVISWFYAEGPGPFRPAGGADGEPGDALGVEPPTGRPRPEVRYEATSIPTTPTASPAPWDEGPIDLAPVSSSLLASRLRAAETEDALQELDGIQRAMGPRRKTAAERPT